MKKYSTAYFIEPDLKEPPDSVTPIYIPITNKGAFTISFPRDWNDPFWWVEEDGFRHHILLGFEYVTSMISYHWALMIGPMKIALSFLK